MAIAMTLRQFLSDQGIAYEVATHPRTLTAAQTAEAVHVTGDRIAKAVVVKDADGYLLAVLPASHHIKLGELGRWLGRPLELATEDETEGLFADCEVGAIPALGSAYGLDVVLDDSLGDQPDIYFEGGDHASLVHVTGEAFTRLMADARRGRFSQHD